MMPLWIEITVALLLLASAALALASAVGLLRLSGFFPRMHVPALTATLGTWCVTGAAALYFWALDGELALYHGLIFVFIILTVPITTVLLTRATLQRLRSQGAQDVPPPLSVHVIPTENQH
jgi:multicomponent K+:H+ antiporter subunit G